MSDEEPRESDAAAQHTPPPPPPAPPPGYQPTYAPPPHQQPPYAPPSQPSAYPPPWTQQYAAPVPPAQPVTAAEPARSSARVPGWLLPVVGVVALVVGLLGGVLGGTLAGRDEAPGTHDVISVQKRQAAPLPADNHSIASVAQKLLPSTVQIVAEYDGHAQGATGSGFVLDRQGHVITNNHVVAQAAKDDGPIEIIDQDGHHSKATVVGRSTVYDLAVLSAPRTKGLRPVSLGSARQMRVGETVVAIGSPLGLSATVTSGIVSAVDRPVTTGEGGDNSYIDAVQTDAAINPGNSGGPLVNLQGQVVGVNSAIASLGSQSASGEGGNIGVGFAIPIEQVQVTTQQILSTGKARYPVIGADVRGTTKLDGATVESITPGMPAAKARLKVGDVIRRVDGKPVSGSVDLVVAIRTHSPGEKVRLTVQRGSRTFDVRVGLDAKTG